MPGDAAPETLQLVLHPERWPNYRLRLKHLSNGQTVELGWIGRTVQPDHILVTAGYYDGEHVLGEFGSIEELAAAGWAVD